MRIFYPLQKQFKKLLVQKNALVLFLIKFMFEVRSKALS
jgi:hypothetical protein